MGKRLLQWQQCPSMRSAPNDSIAIVLLPNILNFTSIEQRNIQNPLASSLTSLQTFPRQQQRYTKGTLITSKWCNFLSYDTIVSTVRARLSRVLGFTLNLSTAICHVAEYRVIYNASSSRITMRLLETLSTCLSLQLSGPIFERLSHLMKLYRLILQILKWSKYFICLL